MIRFICLVLTLFIYSTFVLGEQENQSKLIISLVSFFNNDKNYFII